MGDMIVVRDVHLEVDGTQTVEAGHSIAVAARERVMQRHRVINLLTHRPGPATGPGSPPGRLEPIGIRETARMTTTIATAPLRGPLLRERRPRVVLVGGRFGAAKYAIRSCRQPCRMP